jgi:methylase of polypeptide subunit release factors
MVLKAVNMIRSIVQGVVSEGDLAVDATAGNGHDTLFLASLVGDGGLIYAFDNQQRALDITRERLRAHRLEQRVKLICDGHERMDKYVTDRVKAVVFNLGYLPGGDHGKTTQSGTTMVAVEKSLNLLLPGGICAIAVYRGHEEGQREDALLREYLTSLDPRIYISVWVAAANQRNNPPLVWLVQKKMEACPTNYY